MSSLATISMELLEKLSHEQVTIFDPFIITGDESLLEIGFNTRIDSFTKLEIGRRMRIGRDVHIASFCHLGVGGGVLEIGDGSTCSSGVRVCTGASDVTLEFGRSGSAQHPEFKAIRKHTKIGKNVTIFVNAVILPGVTIGDGAIIAAGSIVTHDVGENELWMGNPARKIFRKELV